MAVKFKIRQHPRMKDIQIGDEVICRSRHLFARVEEIFPAAVCVRLARLHVVPQTSLEIWPELWRADDIDNLSVCKYCATRDSLHLESDTGIPFRICAMCAIHQKESAS